MHEKNIMGRQAPAAPVRGDRVLRTPVLTAPLSAPSTPQGRAILRDLLVIAAVAAALWVAHRLERIVLVLVLAVFLAYVIAPLVELLERPVRLAGRTRRMPRGVAIAAVYVLLLGGVAAGGALLWPRAADQIDNAIASAPKYAESFRTWEHGWSRYYERLRMPAELRHGIDRSVVGAGEAAGEYGRGGLLSLLGAFSALPWLALVPVLAFLMLKDAVAIRRALLTALPHRVQLRWHRLFEELNATLSAFVRAQLIACVLVGVLSGVGLAVLGSPYAILLGVIAGVLEIVPLMGPLALAVLAVVVAALHDPALAVWTALFLAALRVVQDYVIYPRLIGRDIHLHPLVIILAVLAGAELHGMAGVFIAVPLVALTMVVARHWLAWRGTDAASDTEPA
jgi:predicted PurR-regulated permease PerM